MSSQETKSIPFTRNIPVIALVVFMCGVVYFFVHGMSGGSAEISKSVAGAEIVDSRDIVN